MDCYPIAIRYARRWSIGSDSSIFMYNYGARYHAKEKAARIGAPCSPPITLIVHGSSNLTETSNVGATDEGWELALSRREVCFCSTQAVFKALLHDALELLVNLLGCP